MRYATNVLGLFLLVLSPSVALGQTLTPLIKRGETVIGLGAMENASYVSVDDTGTWMALLDTANDDGAVDGCLLSNGFVFLREFSSLYSPVGAHLDEWLSVSQTNRGNLGMLAKAKLSTGELEDGAFWNLVAVALKDDVIVSPELGAGADWDKFFVVKMTSNNTMFVLGEVANPALNPSRAERTLVRYRLDDQGNVLETTVLATEGMAIPAGLTLTGQSCLGNNEHILAVNERGDFITFVGASGTSAFVINMQTIVARVGLPSPVGKDWRQLTLGRVAINDRGDYLVSGAVGEVNDIEGYLIVKNGQKFAQQGDILPALSVSRLAVGGLPPLVIANTGDVFWHARVAGGADDAFMRNYEPIVQRGATMIDTSFVTQLNGAENAFAVSRNGRFFVGNVELQAPGTTLVYVDFGLVLELPGCTTRNKGKLSLQSGQARVGSQFTLAMDAGQAPGAVAAILFSKSLRNPATGCGPIIPGVGEGMLAPPIVSTLRLPDWDGTQATAKTISVPSRLALVDTVFFGQGIFFSAGHPTEELRLTNAVRIELGAP